MVTDISLKNVTCKDRLIYLDVNGGLQLILIWKNYIVNVCTGFIWLRIKAIDESFKKAVMKILFLS
jgi:hypothetical protein